MNKHFQSENYTVAWDAAPTFDPGAELEIGDGSGHGFSLRWFRFQPGKEGVVVLACQLDEGRQPYHSKWPPDLVSATVQRAELPTETYAALLRDLAVVASAKLTPVPRNGGSFSTNDFWVSARLATPEKVLLDLDWAGYESSTDELDYARPRAAVRLVQEAIKGLDFKDWPLTPEDKAWASAKFARDWQSFRTKDYYWWVRERYIQLVGVVGDRAALPVLAGILSEPVPEDKTRRVSVERSTYYAVNAATRLIGQDVRDKPTQEMDLDRTRRKVLSLIADESPKR